MKRGTGTLREQRTEVENGSDATNWQHVRLGDIADLLTGFPFPSGAYADDPSGPRLLRGDNVGQGVLRWDGAKRWPMERDERLQQYWLREGDVILAMDRPWIEAGLKYAAVRSSDVPALLVQRVARIRGGPKLDTRFLKYVIGSDGFTQHVLAVATGTAIPHISGEQIRSYVCHLPPLPEQRAIAQILGTLDDKIELNRRMNETLEAMARALFKSWFVDFDPVRAKAEGRDPGLPRRLADLFPDSFEDSELGEIPKGWPLTPICEAVEGVYDGPHATPRESADGPVYLGIKNFTGSGLDLSAVRRISEADWPTWTRRIVPGAGDIVFTYEATLGFFALLPPWLRCCLGRRTALVRPRETRNNRHYLFHYFVGDLFQGFLRGRTQPGSTVDRILVAEFPNYPVLHPPAALLAEFETVGRNTWARIHASMAELLTLGALRDALLPKLISGEIRVGDAERFAEAAV